MSDAISIPVSSSATSAAPAAPAAPSDKAPATERAIGTSEAPAESTPKKYRVKVDNDDIELTDEDLVKTVKKTREYAKKEKERAQSDSKRTAMEDAAKKGDFSLLFEHLGVEADTWAQQRVIEKYKTATMPEAERKAREIEARERAHEKRVREHEEKMAAEAEEREMAGMRAKYEKDLAALGEKDSLMKNPAFARMVAQEYFQDLDSAEDDEKRNGITLESALPKARAAVRAILKHEIEAAASKPETLLELFGPELIKTLRTTDFESVARSKGQAVAKPTDTADKPPKYKSWADYAKRWGADY